jgi:predicted Zn-dependent protease
MFLCLLFDYVYPKNNLMKKWMSKFFLVLLMVSCVKVPISGRRQMNWHSEQELIQMSKQQYDAFLAFSEVINYGSQLEMVKRVGGRIADAAEVFLTKTKASGRLQGFNWEFNLVRNDQLNAWCMPGGKICFYTGILSVTQDETGLAVVMGHEIAHAIARHGNERMSKSGLVNVGAQVLDVATNQQSESARTLLLNAYGVGTTVGYVLPFSRMHESEADMMGLVFMQLAGYEASEAINFWKRMGEKGTNGPAFLSTHPTDESRVRKIKDFIQSDDFWVHTH